MSYVVLKFIVGIKILNILFEIYIFCHIRVLSNCRNPKPFVFIFYALCASIIKSPVLKEERVLLFLSTLLAQLRRT